MAIRVLRSEVGAEKYDTTEVRALLKENGLRCWGSISLMFTGLDLIQADEAGRANTVQYLKGLYHHGQGIGRRGHEHRSF